MFAMLLLWGSLYVAMLSHFSSGVRRGSKATCSHTNASQNILGFTDVRARDPCPDGVILIATRHGKAVHNYAEDYVNRFIGDPSRFPTRKSSQNWLGSSIWGATVKEKVHDAFDKVVNDLQVRDSTENFEELSLQNQLEAVGAVVIDMIKHNDKRVSRLKRSVQDLRPVAEAAGEAMKKLAILPDIAYLDAELAARNATTSAALEGQKLIKEIVGHGPRMVLVSPLMRAVSTAIIMWGKDQASKFVVDQLGEKRTGYPCDTRQPMVKYMTDEEPQTYAISAKTYQQKLAQGKSMVMNDMMKLIEAVKKAGEGSFFNGGVLFAKPPGTEDMDESAWTSGEWTRDPPLEPNDSALRTRVRAFMEGEFWPLFKYLSHLNKKNRSATSAVNDKTFAFVSHKGWLRELENAYLPPGKMRLYSNAETRIYCLERTKTASKFQLRRLERKV